LELADAEFASVRDDLLSYEIAVKEQLVADPSAVGINQASLGVFLKEAGQVVTMHAYIVEHGGKVSDEPSAEFLGMLTQGLLIVGVTTIEDLQRNIASHLNTVMKFMRGTYRDGTFNGVTFFPGAPLWNLCCLLAIERSGRRGLEEWFEKMQKEPKLTSLDEYVASYQQARTG
jgi:hypothetical protein